MMAPEYLDVYLTDANVAASVSRKDMGSS